MSLFPYIKIFKDLLNDCTMNYKISEIKKNVYFHNQYILKLSNVIKIFIHKIRKKILIYS